MARTLHRFTGVSPVRQAASTRVPLHVLLDDGAPESSGVPRRSPPFTHSPVNRPADAGRPTLIARVGHLLVRGIRFIAHIFSAMTYARREGEMVLHRRLLDAQWRLRRGEIDAAELAQIEQQVRISLHMMYKDD